MRTFHRRRLREQLEKRELLQVPGVYDGLSALLVEQAGFGCAFLSGACLSFARFGRPDMGLVSASAVSYTHLTLPTTIGWCRSRWWAGE